MVARGYSRILNLGLVNMIDINDGFSRVKVLSYPCWLGEKRIERLIACPFGIVKNEMISPSCPIAASFLAFLSSDTSPQSPDLCRLISWSKKE
jgi:hypothetical protein